MASWMVLVMRLSVTGSVSRPRCVQNFSQFSLASLLIKASP
jgi:hypothetical protein